MRAILPVLLLLAPALHAVEEKVTVPPKARSAVSLLPDGSQLHGVMFPRYDENQRLIGTLRAEAMTLVNADSIFGETVRIDFYHADGSPRGRLDLVNADFNQARGILKTTESVTVQTDEINARGSGLHYAFERGEGFLVGPATTWIKAPPKTTMNSSGHSPLRAAAMLGISLISMPVSTAAPDPAATAHPGKAEMLADLDASAAATEAARSFLKDAELISTDSPPTAAAVPDAQPLDVKPGPDDTLITCDGGMYFDADEGLFVFLKNVRVTDPRFTLTGANELKIFLGKKPEDTKKTEPKAPEETQQGIGLGAEFGDVERIMATGAVLLTQKAVEKGKQPVEASGAIFTYQPKTGQIVLNGGYPWVKQGSTFMRAKEPNLILRIQKNGSFVTEGNWDMGGRLDQGQ